MIFDGITVLSDISIKVAAGILPIRLFNKITVNNSEFPFYIRTMELSLKLLGNSRVLFVAIFVGFIYLVSVEVWIESKSM